ncbi:homeodomain-interacting protein kinase 3-like isoform X2 [Vanacampus margaritifer]
MEGSIVESKTSFYHIHKLLDRGTSSHVFKCKNLNTAKDVALKVHKNYALFENEIEMQEIVSVLDPDKKSIVEFIETFTFNRHPCLVFELLDTNLFSMVLDKKWKTFSPNDIRPVAQQLLTAFEGLKSIGVIHTDLKSDNIMLVDHGAAPFRVKLIDFGLSICTVDAPLSYGVALQPMGNRAPEVALGLPFSEAIDMWSLGCVLSFLYLGNYLFLANSNYNMLRSMIEVVGRIPDHLLTASKNTHKYFKRSDKGNDGDHPKWRLMTAREYQDKTGVRPESLPWSFKCLDDLVKLKPEVSEPLEFEDRKAFVDLLKRLLQMDPERRITPEDALKHPFLTMSHLSEHKTTSLYAIDSFEKMKFCPAGALEEDEPDAASNSARTLKSRNWRQRFCGFLGPSRTADVAATPPSSRRADEEPPAQGQEVKPKTWWQKLCQLFRGNKKPLAAGPPAPRVQAQKTRWFQSLFLRMNRIVPEAKRVPLQPGSVPTRVWTQPDRDLRRPPDKSLQMERRERLREDVLSRRNKSTQINNMLRVDDERSLGADEWSRAEPRSLGADEDRSSPARHRSSRANREPSSRLQEEKRWQVDDKSSRAKDRPPPPPPVGKIARAHPPTHANKSRVKHDVPAPANKRVHNDKWSHVNKLLRVKRDDASQAGKSRGKKDATSRAEKSSRVQTDESSRVYKLRVKTDESPSVHKWHVQKPESARANRSRVHRDKSASGYKMT